MAQHFVLDGEPLPNVHLTMRELLRSHVEIAPAESVLGELDADGTPRSITLRLAHQHAMTIAATIRDQDIADTPRIVATDSWLESVILMWACVEAQVDFGVIAADETPRSKALISQVRSSIGATVLAGPSAADIGADLIIDPFAVSPTSNARSVLGAAPARPARFFALSGASTGHAKVVWRHANEPALRSPEPQPSPPTASVLALDSISGGPTTLLMTRGTHWAVHPTCFRQRPATLMELIERHEIGHLALAPQVLVRLVRLLNRTTTADLSCLKVISVGSELITHGLLRTARTGFNTVGAENIVFGCGYGMTETGIIATAALVDDVDVPDGEPVTFSAAGSGRRVRISTDAESTPLDELGEIEVWCEAAAFAGYDDASRAEGVSLTEDGWIRTGDLGMLTATGLRLVGRRGTGSISTRERILGLETEMRSVRGIAPGQLWIYANSDPETGLQTVAYVPEIARLPTFRTDLHNQVQSIIERNADLIGTCRAIGNPGRTRVGKINFGQLAKVPDLAVPAAPIDLAGRTQDINAAWLRTLALNDLRSSATKDFAELGGDSLGLVSLIEAIEAVYDTELDFEAILEHPRLDVVRTQLEIALRAPKNLEP